MEPYLHSVTRFYGMAITYEQEELYLSSTKHYDDRTERFNTAVTIVLKAKC